MRLVKRISTPNKDILKVMGVKFTYNKKEKTKEKFDSYSKNRFYNDIIDRIFPQKAKRGILEDRFYKMVGYFPNLDNPRTFNEKLTWMKLYYKNPLMTRCVDKITFKEYIREQLGEGYTVPLLKVYNNVNDIKLEDLPQQFALKSNCGWGGLQVVAVKDKSKVTIDEIKYQVNPWLIPWNNYYYQSFEWDSKAIVPQIMAEEYIEQDNGQLTDYKIHCFNGKPVFVLVISERFGEKTINKTFLDMDWKLMDLKRPNADVNPNVKCPPVWEEMVSIAAKLAQPFPFVRIDFYYCNNKLYVGEMTFMPGGGLEQYEPVDWDLKFGEMLQLPQKSEDD